MNKFQGTRTRRAAAALVTVAALAAGLATATSSMAAASGFDARIASVIAHVKDEPGYKKIPLDSSADRAWFFSESEALFKKKISKEQYVTEGSKQFPGYEASFSELADLITAP